MRERREDLLVAEGELQETERIITSLTLSSQERGLLGPLNRDQPSPSQGESGSDSDSFNTDRMMLANSHHHDQHDAGPGSNPSLISGFASS